MQGTSVSFDHSYLAYVVVWGRLQRDDDKSAISWGRIYCLISWDIEVTLLICRFVLLRRRFSPIGNHGQEIRPFRGTRYLIWITQNSLASGMLPSTPVNHPSRSRYIAFWESALGLQGYTLSVVRRSTTFLHRNLRPELCVSLESCSLRFETAGLTVGYISDLEQY